MVSSNASIAVLPMQSAENQSAASPIGCSALTPIATPSLTASFMTTIEPGSNASAISLRSKLWPISRDQTRRRGPSTPQHQRFGLEGCGVLDALGSQNKCNTCYGVVAMGQVYGQLSLEERIEIYRRRRGGDSLLEIARRLGRHVSTISRELKRNSLATKAWSNGYCPVRAQQLTERRRRWDGRFKLARQPDLQNLVKDRLAMGHSPEQIAGRLTLEHGHTVISHESIYRF